MNNKSRNEVEIIESDVTNPSRDPSKIFISKTTRFNTFKIETSPRGPAGIPCDTDHVVINEVKLWVNEQCLRLFFDAAPDNAFMVGGDEFLLGDLGDENLLI